MVPRISSVVRNWFAFHYLVSYKPLTNQLTNPKAHLSTYIGILLLITVKGMLHGYRIIYEHFGFIDILSCHQQMG